MCNGNKELLQALFKWEGKKYFIATKTYFGGKMKAGTFQIPLFLYNSLPLILSDCCYSHSTSLQHCPPSISMAPAGRHSFRRKRHQQVLRLIIFNVRGTL